jgi:hypothetical protein
MAMSSRADTSASDGISATPMPEATIPMIAG